VQPLLRGRFGRPYRFEQVCASTQDLLRDAALPEGAVAAAAHQTAGRGRLGRSWEDVPGESLLCSILLRPPISAALPQLSLVCALAAAEAIEATGGATAAIKWPNDVLLGGRKVAGILLESSAGAVICGIGVNVGQPAESLPVAPRVAATSMFVETGARHDRGALLATLLAQLEARYGEWLASGLEPLLPELDRRDALRGARVRVAGERGIAAGVAPDGTLAVRLDRGGITRVGSGEVQIDLEEPPTETGVPPHTPPTAATDQRGASD
jgi:BirA family biotin operon repressor/biotin-[acetyl-CoA-carboxylase] ligase